MNSSLPCGTRTKGQDKGFLLSPGGRGTKGEGKGFPVPRTGGPVCPPQAGPLVRPSLSYFPEYWNPVTSASSLIYT
jgi:hypothetical protein